MTKFAAIALRNLARNRRRTLLSLLIIAAGSIGILLTAGFVRFSFEGLREAIIHGGLGHLEAVPAAALAAGARPERAGLPALEGWEPLRAEIERAPHVLAAAGAIHLTGIASLRDRSAAVLAVAVEPDRERRMAFELKLRAGANLAGTPPAEGEDAALLGVALAESLGAAPGDVITVLAMTSDGTLNALDLTVAGLITTGLQDLDARFLKTHLATAQRLLETTAVSSILVGLDDTSRTDQVRADLTGRVAGHQPAVALADWQSRAPFYGQVRALYSSIYWFLGGIVFVLVCLSTSNTLMMSVMERVREIGTLRAIGTSANQVAAIVLAEALWLGLLGALAGSVLGLGIVAAINAVKIKMPPPPGAADGIELQLAVRPEDFAAVLVLMLAVLAVAAVFPVARSVRLRIADALGHV